MIGLFDSGLGGLSVVRSLLHASPDAEFVYLGDTARTPYGNKTPETICRYAMEDAAFLVAQGTQKIVIACNSVSAVGAGMLRERYPSLKIYDVISPAVEDALAATHGRIGIIGTRATIASRAYERALTEQSRSKKLTILPQTCPLLVPLVEEGWLDHPETKRIVRQYLSSLRHANVDTLILGCTHYPFLAPLIARYMGRRVTLIDSGASAIRRLLADGDPPKPGAQSYFLTDVSSQSQIIAQAWLKRSIAFERAVL